MFEQIIAEMQKNLQSTAPPWWTVSNTTMSITNSYVRDYFQLLLKSMFDSAVFSGKPLRIEKMVHGIWLENLTFERIEKIINYLVNNFKMRFHSKDFKNSILLLDNNSCLLLINQEIWFATFEKFNPQEFFKIVEGFKNV